HWQGVPQSVGSFHLQCRFVAQVHWRGETETVCGTVAAAAAAALQTAPQTVRCEPVPRQHLGLGLLGLWMIQRIRLVVKPRYRTQKQIIKKIIKIPTGELSGNVTRKVSGNVSGNWRHI